MRFLDLFAGIGGFRMGLELNGHECVGFVECDPYCINCKAITQHLPSDERNFTICTVCGTKKRQHARFSYEAIYDTEGEWTGYDITTISDNDFRLLRGRVDLICGGFPCQPFSIASKQRRGFEDTRGTLFFDVARAIKQIKPRYLLFENVKGLLSHDKGNTFAVILNTLAELGYDAEWQVFNTKDFSTRERPTPQNRERVYIVGYFREGSGPKILPIYGESGENKIKQIGNLLDTESFGGNPQVGRVYDPVGLAPTLNTMQGGGREPKVAIYDMSQAKREGKPRIYEHYAPTITARDYKEPRLVAFENKIIKHEVVEMVKIRKFKVDTKALCELLRKAKENVKLTNKKISEQLKVPQTEVEHWFRKDESFAIPRAEVWSDLKALLQIKDNSFDEAITTYIEKPNSYDIANRAYDEKGISPTITASTRGEKLVLSSNNFVVRKLIPLETWRLQGFPDWAFHKAASVNSDSQLYKQAGNSVTVNVAEKIGEKLKLLEKVEADGK